MRALSRGLVAGWMLSMVLACPVADCPGWDEAEDTVLVSGGYGSLYDGNVEGAFEGSDHVLDLDVEAGTLTLRWFDDQGTVTTADDDEQHVATWTVGEPTRFRGSY
jgi:hypothetical protein